MTNWWPVRFLFVHCQLCPPSIMHSLSQFGQSRLKAIHHRVEQLISEFYGLGGRLLRLCFFKNSFIQLVHELFDFIPGNFILSGLYLGENPGRNLPSIGAVLGAIRVEALLISRTSLHVDDLETMLMIYLSMFSFSCEDSAALFEL